MQTSDIVKIIRKHVQDRGLVLEERESSSTNSLYFKIHDGDVSLLFRVSDHSTKKNVITFRTDMKQTPKTIEGFVNNRCDDLKYRKLKSLLGI